MRPRTEPAGAEETAASPRHGTMVTSASPTAPIARQAEEPARGSPTRVSRSTPGRLKYKPDSLLAARAATEYRYVDQDLRRIAILGAVLFGVLLVLWLALVPLDVFGIY
jgi:hypothetical protein